MNQPDDSAPPVYEPDEHPAYTTEVCARITGVSTETIVRYREQGLIQPIPNSNRFDDETLRTVRKLEHLRSTCGVNDTGLKLILSLMNEVESLRETIRTFR